MSDEDVQIKFGASIEGINAAVAEVKESLEGLTGPITDLQENLAGVGEAMIAAFAVEKIGEFISEMAELGEQVGRTAEMLGMTTEQVTALQFASAATGGSASQMSSLLERLSHTMQAAAEGGKSQIAAFKEAGVAYEDAEGHLRPLPDMLADIATRFQDAPDGPEKTALAIALMGRAGADAIPLLNKGADGLEELAKQAEAAGVVMDEKTQKAFEATAEKLTTLNQSFTGLGEQIMSAFTPAINTLVDIFTQFVEGMISGIQNGNLLGDILKGVAFAANAVVASILTMTTAFEVLWQVAEGIIRAIGNGLLSIAKAMIDTMAGNFAGSEAEMSSGWDKIVGIATDGASRVGQILGNYTKDLAELNGAVGEHVAVSTKPQPFSVGKTGGTGAGGASDRIDAERAAIDGEIRVDQEGLARKRSILDDELKMHQISESQWVQQSEAAVNAEYQAELGLLQKELQLGGLKLIQRQEILNKIDELEQKHATAIVKIQQKAAADSQAAWTKMTDSIASAINSQVGSLLKGTETVGQALQNIALDLTTQFIENAIKSLLASAAQTFGGIFAFLAPTMGPAAAGPAAAGQAAVMAAGSALPSLDVGTWGLPSDGPIMAHKGETIIPAFEAGQFREAIANLSSGRASGGNGGAPTIHFNGPVMDKAGLARAVSDMFTANPSLRPKY